jgi:Cytochrome C oxidase, cbb3-type, subunit III
VTEAEEPGALLGEWWTGALIRIVGPLAICVIVLVGCTQEMAEQPRCGPLQSSEFFDSGRCARPLVEGTVARGYLHLDEHLYAGKVAGGVADTLPFPLTWQVLERGQERFNIYCTPCHDYLGSGQGMIVRRGFTPPPSFHIERLRQAPVGYFFDVMTNGYGAMPEYRKQVSDPDRWAIAAYIRALQLSQHATLADVPEEAKAQLQETSR